MEINKQVAATRPVAAATCKSSRPKMAIASPPAQSHAGPSPAHARPAGAGRAPSGLGADLLRHPARPHARSSFILRRPWRRSRARCATTGSYQSGAADGRTDGQPASVRLGCYIALGAPRLAPPRRQLVS